MPCKEFMQARNEKYALTKTIAEISSASFLLHEICKLLTFERTRGFPRTRLCWWWWGRGYRWSPRTWGCLPILFKPRMEGNKNEPKKMKFFWTNLMNILWTERICPRTSWVCFTYTTRAGTDLGQTLALYGDSNFQNIWQEIINRLQRSCLHSSNTPSLASN